jgi:hypothetical protein
VDMISASGVISCKHNVPNTNTPICKYQYTSLNARGKMKVLSSYSRMIL